MITENKTYVSKACSGGVVDFDFDFPVEAESSVGCYYLSTAGAKTELVNPTHFSVDSTDWTAGGTLTLVTAYSNGSLIIYRDEDFLQSDDLINDPSIEDVVDKLKREIQQLKERVYHSVRGPVGEQQEMELPPVDERSTGQALVADTNGNIVMGTLTNASVSPYMQSVLDDLTAAAARTTLDVYGQSETYTNTEVDTEISTRLGQVEITAGETITAGKVVALDSSGELTHTLNRLPIIETIASHHSAADVANNLRPSACFLTDTTLVWAFETGEVRVCTLQDDGQLKVAGTAYEFDSVATIDTTKVLRLSSTKFAVIYEDTNTARAIAGTVSGEVITLGSSVQLSSNISGAGNKQIVAAMLTDSLFVAMHSDSGDLLDVTAVSASGTTLTAGTSVNVGSSGTSAGMGNIIRLDDDKFALTQGSVGTYTQCGTVSGETITLGSAVEIFTDTYATPFMGPVCVYLSSTSYLAINNGGSVLVASIVSVSGTTVTPGSYIENVGLPRATGQNRVLEPLIDSELFLMYYTGGDKRDERPFFVKVDGSDVYPLFPSNENQIRIGDYDDYEEFASAPTSAFVVGVSDGLGILTISALAADWVGIATEAGAASAEITVQREGVVTGLSGLTAGSTYYTQDDGTLVTTYMGESRRVGIAISTTELLIKK